MAPKLYLCCMSAYENFHGYLGLPRAHILRGHKAITNLFNTGKSITLPPLRLVYLWHQSDQEPPLRVIFSVSKRNFRRAVVRNRIKRLLREAWRKNNWPLWEMVVQKGRKLHVAVIYTKTDLPDYATVERKIIEAIHRLKTLNEDFE